MNWTRFGRLAVLLCAAVFVLQGCGGDDDGNVEQDLRDQINMLMGERDAASAAQAGAEAAQAAAEMAQSEAEAAEGMADIRRDEAIAAEAVAMQASMDAAAAKATAEMERDEAEAAESAATAMLSQVNVDLAATRTAQMAAETAKMEAEAAEAAAVMAADAAMAAQMMAEDARDAAMAAQMMAEDTRDAAMAAQMTAEMERDAAKQAQMDAEDAQAAAETERDQLARLLKAASDTANSTRANSLGKAIEAFINNTDASERRPNAPEDVEIMHGAEGLVYTPDDKPLEFDEYRPSDDTSPEIQGWRSAVLTRPRGGTMDIIYVYSDIEDSEMKTFGAVHGTSVVITNMNVANAKSTEFPGPGDQEQSYAANDVAFAGYYDGVPGTFDCTGNACTANAAADGKIMIVGDLTFTPGDTSDMVRVQDSDYLRLGFWLNKPSSPSATHNFSTFAGGSGDAFSIDMLQIADDVANGLAGRARYSGVAAGKYVFRNLGANLNYNGIFTATATLAANFDREGGPDGVLGTGMIGDADTVDADDIAAGLKGSIENFMDENGDGLGNWKVTLSHDLFNRDDDSGNDAFGDGAATTTATIGAAQATGNWGATFHGTRTSDRNPASVIGEFDAHAAHATLAGSFGARDIMPDE